MKSLAVILFVAVAVWLQTGCEPSYTSSWKPVDRSQLAGKYVTSMEPLQSLTLFSDGIFVHEFDIGADHFCDTSGWRFEADNKGGCFIVFDSARCFRFDPYRAKADPYFEHQKRGCGLYKGKVVIAADITDVPYLFVKK